MSTQATSTERVALGDAMKLFNELERSGKIFSAVFVKKDHSIRKMNCKFHVRTRLSGGGLKFRPVEKGLKVVFDLQKDEYRCINLNTLILIRYQGKNYIFN